MSREYIDAVAAVVKDTRFKRKLFGGVDEADVWKKLQAICDEYDKAFDLQEAYYKGLLDSSCKNVTDYGDEVDGN